MDESLELIGRVLEHLHKKGLRRVDFWLADLYGGQMPEGEWADFDSHFSDVMHWLERENAIAFQDEITGTVGESGFISVQLTSRGLALLKAPTGDALPKPSIEETVARGGDSLAPSMYVKIGSAVGGLLGGFTKAIS